MSPHDIDALYRSFPSFTEWSKCRVDHARWDRYTEILRIRGEASPEQLAAAREVVQRAAAVDTGALEGLYEVDRGFTFTVATQAAVWEAALDAKGQQARALIESQLGAYEYVLDTATQREPITEAWIRTLHEELCRSQETYLVMTAVGPQTHPLPVGEYKHLPNHVRKADGSTHAYSPVDLVPAEMHRLVESLRTPEFLGAHPVLQAAYAHYAFILIHPFADGNGRVARALASVFTYRAASIPLLILAESRGEYLKSLEAADAGDLQVFCDFVMDRALDAILLVDESLQTAMGSTLDGAVSELEKLYLTDGGFAEEEVDKAGLELFELFALELSRQAEAIDSRWLKVSVISSESEAPQVDLPRVRSPHPHPRMTRTLHVSMQAAAPASVSKQSTLCVVVPQNASGEDDASIVDIGTKSRVFSARLSELIPHPSAALGIRARIASERFAAQLVSAVQSEARRKLKGGSTPTVE